MEIAGFRFRLKTDEVVYNGPGVFLYKHLGSSKFFIKAVDCCRRNSGKNNYPLELKELLKRDASDVLLYICEVDRDKREMRAQARMRVRAELTERGELFQRGMFGRGVYDLSKKRGDKLPRYTVWSMTDKATGAVFYFPEKIGYEVRGKVNGRVITFNGYVVKQNVNANRSLFNFAKKHFPLTFEQWVVRDLLLDLETEEMAEKEIAKRSKNDLQAGGIVLSKICGTDAFYYRNEMLRLHPVSMEQYLTPKAG